MAILPQYKSLLSGRAGSLYRDAEEDLEAGHVCVQRQAELPAHHHHAEQVRAALLQRAGPLLPGSCPQHGWPRFS